MRRFVLMTAAFCSVLVLLVSTKVLAQGHFVYLNNAVPGDNTVSAFSVSPSGNLTPILGSPFHTAGSGSDSYFSSTQITIVGNFLYAVNSNSKNISGFSIGPLTGGLTPVPGSPFSVLGISFGIPMSIAVTPDGKYLFADNADFITGYRIQPDGSLSTMPESPFNQGGDLFDSMKVTPDGKFLLLSDYSQLRALMGFSIGPTGLLERVLGSPFSFTLPAVAAGIDVNCASNLVFVGGASLGPGVVGVLSLAADGTLSQIPGSPFTPGIGLNSGVVHLSPDEKHLFVSNQNSNNITVYDVQPNGGLSVVPGSPFPIAGLNNSTLPAGMATNQSGTLLYTAIYPNLVSVHAINSNGSLSEVPGSPFSNGYQFFQSRMASLASYPAKICGPTFDTCIQDDGNGSILEINSTTGDYRFSNCSGLVISGVGSLLQKGSLTTLQHYASDRRILARVDGSVGRATASIGLLSQGGTLTITDRNTKNSTCACR